MGLPYMSGEWDCVGDGLKKSVANVCNLEAGSMCATDREKKAKKGTFLTCTGVDPDIIDQTLLPLIDVASATIPAAYDATRLNGCTG